jgi:acyl-CoA synthetase (AMP-forming)/AMP-acid ligase II
VNRDLTPNSNIARHLGAMAAAQSQIPALKVPRGRTRAGGIDYLTLSFSELDSEVSAWVARLGARGLRRGDRTLLMVRPGLPLIACAFALFRAGAVPVVIDPGMGLASFLRCVAGTRPRALVGIPLAQALSRILRGAFRSVEVRVPVSSSLTSRLNREGGPSRPAGPEIAQNAPGDLAAILFTSGSTGAPKGVRYEHGMFDAQVRLIRETYGIEPGEIDLPLLPIFALFNPALGMTTVVPEIDPRRPAAADPSRIVQAIRQEGVTNSFGSPTLWRIVSDHCRERGTSLPSLKRVLCAGAPVPAALWASSRDFLPNGRLHSPYGATEALPVTSIAADERESLGPSPGACVGKPVAGIGVKIIAIADRSIPALSQADELPAGTIGEIIVSGPVVTREYDGPPELTAAAKIRDGDVTWHRMGDCGYLDHSGRLWFCGRKAERIETAEGTLFTEPCEQVFRGHPRAGRCALIGLGPPGRQEPAIVAETAPGSRGEAASIARELRKLALGNPLTSKIRRFYFRPRFPVDVRHNAKIHRLALARWAARRSPAMPDE